MKKITIKGKKHWKIFCSSSPDILAIGAVLSASGTDWDPVDYSTVNVFCGKKKAMKLQKLILGMSEVGVLKGSISMEVFPHR